VDSTSFNPIWDKTGNYLYFLASKIDLARKLDPLIDERLMRYDARTQKTESLLSLKEQQQPNRYIRSLSISPDGNTLMLQSGSSQTKLDMVFVDTQSLKSTKLTLDLTDLKLPLIAPFNYYDLQTAWSPDSQNLILLAGNYGSFYMLNIKTGKATIFSGKHSVASWAVSPIATTP
jgi:WD40 repeat protein